MARHLSTIHRKVALGHLQMFHVHQNSNNFLIKIINMCKTNRTKKNIKNEPVLETEESELSPNVSKSELLQPQSNF